MKKKNVSLHNIKNILKDKLEEDPETIKKKNYIFWLTAFDHMFISVKNLGNEM